MSSYFQPELAKYVLASPDLTSLILRNIQLLLFKLWGLFVVILLWMTDVRWYLYIFLLIICCWLNKYVQRKQESKHLCVSSCFHIASSSCVSALQASRRLRGQKSEQRARLPASSADWPTWRWWTAAESPWRWNWAVRPRRVYAVVFPVWSPGRWQRWDEDRFTLDESCLFISSVCVCYIMIFHAGFSPYKLLRSAALCFKRSHPVCCFCSSLI